MTINFLSTTSGFVSKEIQLQFAIVRRLKSFLFQIVDLCSELELEKFKPGTIEVIIVSLY